MSLKPFFIFYPCLICCLLGSGLLFLSRGGGGDEEGCRVLSLELFLRLLLSLLRIEVMLKLLDLVVWAGGGWTLEPADIQTGLKKEREKHLPKIFSSMQFILKDCLGVFNDVTKKK